MTWSVESCAQRVEAGERIGPDDARDLLTAARRDPWSVWLAADRVRRRFRGRSVHLCSIAAVRVGRCGEDCRWCAQSAHWETGVAPRDPLSTEEVVRAAESAETVGAGHLGLVSSGGRLSDAEFDGVLAAGRAVRDRTDLGPAAG